MELTPGLRLILRNAPTLTFPPLLVYFTANVLQIPLILTVLAYICSVPLYVLARYMWNCWVLGQEMDRLGAQAVPLWTGQWPGHVDLLLKLYKDWINGYPCDGLDDATATLGLTFRTNVFGIDQVWTSDPRHIQSILSTDFDGYAKGERVISTLSSVLGTGIFNSDGDNWKFHRGITRPYFHKDRISDFELFEKHADYAISQIRARTREGQPVEFQDVMARFTLDTATAFLLGSSVDSLSAGLPYPVSRVDGSTTINPRHHSDIFIRAFTSAQHTICARGWAGPFWPLFEMFGDATKHDNEIIDGFLGPILKDALTKKAEHENGWIKPSPENEEDTLLNSLIAHTDDFKLLRDETLNILLAGRDSSASLLTFVIYCLSQHPTVAEKFRQEIIHQVGLFRSPTCEDIKTMKYTRAILNETLRLFPPVPLNVRETTRATTWPPNEPGEKPFYLPAKTSIVYSPLLMHRNTGFWGPDALEFDPDRFLDERLHKYLSPNPFIFLPFNAGPRLCLGREFAYNETSFILIRLFQVFESVSLAPDAQPVWSRPPVSWKAAGTSGKRKSKEEIWPKADLTMYAHGGLWVTLTEAAGSEVA